MKKLLALLLALAMIFALAACGETATETPAAQGGDAPAADGGDQPAGDAPAAGTSDLAGTYKITVWVGESAVDLTKKQIEDFNASNDLGIVFEAEVHPVSEATAADQMLVDINAGADLYCFPQDQFARLVQAGALNPLGVKAAETVTAANDAGVVAAATSGDTLYAYPLTSDNGYFMYYDKSVIPEEDVDSLEKLIADCEAADKFFAFEAQTSAWYIASWFFATGCVSEWTTDDDGQFISVKDTFNSPEGLIAVKGMQKLLKSPKHLSSSSADEFANGAAIVVTGTWAFDAVKDILGDNMGVTDLPSFEVDGQEYHLGSFNGCKLMGVKPQGDDTKKQAALHRLAQYLTGEQCQMERFEALSWGPANLNAQASPEVQANPGLAALLLQNQYSIPQGQIHGSWWDIAKVIGDDVKAAEDEAGLQAALDNYYNKITSLFNMTEEEKNSWGVIGMCNSTDGFFFTDYNNETRSNWGEDIPMEEISDGVWQTVQAWEIPEGCEFKVRQGASWDVAFPADNFKVETAGTYFIQFDSNTETITLIPA